MGIAEDRGYSQEYGRIAKVRYSHDAMIDLIIAKPTITQQELGLAFDYTEPWISRVIGSDAFQARLAERKAELVDPAIAASIENRIQGLAVQSLDILADKLQSGKSADLALKVAEMTTKSLGFGARDRSGGVVNNNFVVALPEKAQSAAAWAEAHDPRNVTIDVRPDNIQRSAD